MKGHQPSLPLIELFRLGWVMTGDGFRMLAGRGFEKLRKSTRNAKRKEPAVFLFKGKRQGGEEWRCFEANTKGMLVTRWRQPKQQEKRAKRRNVDQQTEQRERMQD